MSKSLYVYDNAIVSDLAQCFNPNAVSNPVVRVISPENAIEVAAQIQNDQLSFPLAMLTRSDDISIDTNRTNFTRMHKGVQSVIDPETNLLYYEKVIPIKLAYSLTLLTTNTADMDELIRELLFKYTAMYFLTIELPYECKRKVRFGIRINADSTITRSSSSGDYLSKGQLYQAIISLVCDGCVLVNYTPAKLTRTAYEIESALK